MELNREQIVKALECCHKSGTIDGCVECPYFTNAELCDNIRLNAAALIKELTEDVERLRKQCGDIIVECDERDAERLMQVAKLTEENERLKKSEKVMEYDTPWGKTTIPTLLHLEGKTAEVYNKIKADTVREFAERLKDCIHPDADYSGYDIKRVIEQIANDIEGVI